MCGRFVIISPPVAMRELFRYPEQPNFPPRYNVAPTQPIPIVRISERARHFALVRWGLIPAWVKDPKAFTLLINARGESVNDKPAFRNAMKYRRCLVPADGFYEWKREGAVKRPYFVGLKDGAPFAFAGLWENWIGPNGEEVESAAIVTTDASPSIAHIHHRMPVMLPPESFEAWLDTANVDAQQAALLFKPVPDEKLEAREISDAVNKVANDTPALLAPRAADDVPAPQKPARKPKLKDDGQAEMF